MSIVKEISEKEFLKEVFRCSTNPQARRLRALSENEAAALSAVEPGDTALVVQNKEMDIVKVVSVHEDSKGKPIYQKADGRVLSGSRLLGQFGASITAHDEPDEDAPEFDHSKADSYLEMPETARLFGLALAENPTGFSTPCLFCHTNKLQMTPHRGMWLFKCECGKKGDVMDLVCLLTIGEDWSPDGMTFDEIADIVMPAIHERLGHE